MATLPASFSNSTPKITQTFSLLGVLIYALMSTAALIYRSCNDTIVEAMFTVLCVNLLGYIIVLSVLVIWPHTAR